MKSPLILLLAAAALHSPAFAAEPAAVLSSSAETETFAGKGLEVRMVAEVTAVTAGQPFYAGLWIRHEPGYHTYWSQPGIAGVPTRVDWELPEGFSVSPQLFPPPHKVKMAALGVHGYDQDTLIAVRISPPADWKGTSLALRGTASWMCCRRTCNPGFAKLALTLPAGPPDLSPEWSPRFQSLRDSQPRAAEGWTFTATRGETGILLTGRPATPETPSTPPAPQFFSSDNLICSHPAQNWESDSAGGFRVNLTFSDFQPNDTSRLKGLLFGATGWNPGGRERYVSIDVPISGTASAKNP